MPTSAFTASLSAEIHRCSARANEQAARLRAVGDQVLDTTGEIRRDAGPRTLLQYSAAIRGIVGQALTIITELQGEAGRLEAFAALQQAQPFDESGA